MFQVPSTSAREIAGAAATVSAVVSGASSGGLPSHAASSQQPARARIEIVNLDTAGLLGESREDPPSLRSWSSAGYLLRAQHERVPVGVLEAGRGSPRLGL